MNRKRTSPGKPKGTSAKRVALTALLTAAALVAFLIENLFPPLFPAVPFVRLGLSNFFVLFALVLCGRTPALLVLTAKTLLGALLSARVASLPVGIAGGAASYVVMAALTGKKSGKYFGFFTVSALGAAAGNLFRTLTAAAMTGTAQLLSFLPYAALVGLVVGGVLGAALQLSLRLLPLPLLSRIHAPFSGEE